MKLWIGAETQADTIDKFRVTRIKLEKAINEKIQEKNYDIPLTAWDVIIILRDDSEMEEIIKYSKKKKEMDFRLSIDYKTFQKSNELETEKLLFEVLKESLDLLKQKFIHEPELNELITDIIEVGKEKNWI